MEAVVGKGRRWLFHDGYDSMFCYRFVMYNPFYGSSKVWQQWGKSMAKMWKTTPNVVFAISTPPPICYSSFSFIGGVAKEVITKLGCEKYFCRVTYWAPPEMLLEDMIHKKEP
jgi:hypothetical protein